MNGPHEGVVSDEEDSIDNRNIKELSVEETKLLGGTESTTHLVRGIDVKLYEREIERLRKEEEERKAEEASESLSSRSQPDSFRVVSDVGKSIVSLLRGQRELRRRHCTESFLPGRLAYRWNTKAPQDSPVSILRSGSAGSNRPQTILAFVTESLLSEVKSCFESARMGTRRKPRRIRQEEDKEVLPIPKRQAVESISIFDDVGEYIPAGGTEALCIRNVDEDVSEQSKLEYDPFMMSKEGAKTAEEGIPTASKGVKMVSSEAQMTYMECFPESSEIRYVPSDEEEEEI